MSEVLPHTSPTPESLPETPETDAEVVAEQPSFKERAYAVANRIDSVLEARLRTKQEQKDAYDSYADNIATTKSREKSESRAERKAKVHGVLEKISNSSLSFLESQGIIPLRGTWHKQGQGKLNMNFSAWVARKYVAAKERRNNRLAGFLSDEQNAALAGEAGPAVSDTATESEEPTVELPPVPADTAETTPEPTADSSPETTTTPPADSEAPAEPAEEEPAKTSSEHEDDYVRRAREEAEAQARTAEEQRHAHDA